MAPPTRNLSNQQGQTPASVKSTNLAPNAGPKMPNTNPQVISAPAGGTLHTMATAPVKPPLNPQTKTTASVKTFAVKRNDPSDYGKKLVVYGPAGAGKSSLCAMIPNAVFLNLNKGLTGLNVQVVDGVASFPDLRAAVQQATSFVPANGTLVVDTVSEADEFIVDYLKSTHNKDSVAKLGYDKFPCATEALRLLLSDFDALIQTKRNVVLIAHEATINYKNALGEDYKQIGPKLLHSANDSCRDAIVAWSDHTIRVALADAQVVTQVKDGKIIGGKAIKTSTERYISTDGTQSLIAKSRPILVAGTYYRLPGLIAFAGPQDDSLWKGLSDPTIFNQE